MERQTMLCLTKHVLNFRGYCRIKREFKVKKDMDRRDFLKTLAVTGAAMTIQLSLIHICMAYEAGLGLQATDFVAEASSPLTSFLNK